MYVKELREILEEYDEEMEIVFLNDEKEVCELDKEKMFVFIRDHNPKLALQELKSNDLVSRTNENEKLKSALRGKDNEIDLLKWRVKYLSQFKPKQHGRWPDTVTVEEPLEMDCLGCNDSTFKIKCPDCTVDWANLEKE